MNNRKYLLVACLVSVVLGASFAMGETVTDSKNDVYHWKWDESNNIYSWKESVTSRSDIDINDLIFDEVGQNVILTLTVHGTIKNSENIVYWAYYNTTDSFYSMSYTNGTGFCMGSSSITTDFSWGNTTVSGNKITGTVKAVGTGQKEAFYGWAGEYTKLGDTSAEWWGDWAPQDASPWYGLDENGGDNGGTPGFEILLITGAIVALVLIKKNYWKKA
jgi:hypothetical protein